MISGNIALRNTQLLYCIMIGDTCILVLVIIIRQIEEILLIETYDDFGMPRDTRGAMFLI